MNWLEILKVAFEIVIFPAIVAVAAYFITWLNAKKQELLKKAKNETEAKYIELLDKTITECVLATSQTYVNTLKEEGKFDEAAQKSAFQKTFDAVMAVLTDDAQIYLSEVTKDLTVYITNKIEATVKLTK